ncbi:MAG: PQQ-dependent sugar dehydrogenase [Planctomycetota bacterium]
MNRHAIRPVALAVLASVATACAQQPIEGPVPITGETPNATGYAIEVVLDGLDHPWAIAWLPDGRQIITERPGNVLLVDGSDIEYVEGAPPAAPLGQGGLMDVALHPNFATNNVVYFTYASGTARANRTIMARGTLALDADGGPRIDGLEEIFRVAHDKRGGQHFGSRILWLPDGTMLVSIGDGGNPPVRLGDDWIRNTAQSLDHHFGKTLRLNDDGTPADGNPFAVGDGATGIAATVYTYGHRNIQGMARNPETGTIWATEHGARGGDELNRITPGSNYGWPLATYSREYRGPRISDTTTLEGGVQPDVVWTPCIAPSGLAFYTGDQFEDWQGDLFAGGLILEQIRRVDLDGDDVVKIETIPIGKRVRDVRQGPDGFLYVLTDEQQGQLLRLVPSEE